MQKSDIRVVEVKTDIDNIKYIIQYKVYFLFKLFSYWRTVIDEGDDGGRLFSKHEDANREKEYMLSRHEKAKNVVKIFS